MFQSFIIFSYICVTKIVGPDRVAYCCALRGTRWRSDTFAVVGLATSFLLQYINMYSIHFIINSITIIWLDIISSAVKKRQLQAVLGEKCPD